MSLILSDVDGVVADLIPSFVEWVEQNHGVIIPLDKITVHSNMGSSPDLREQNEALKIYFKDGVGGAFKRFMQQHDVYDFVSPVEGAVETIAGLRRHGYQLVFVTAMMKSAREHFKSKMEWIEKWFPGISIFTAPSEEKFRITGDFCIDDRYDICCRWESVGVTPFLFRQPWNEAPTGTPSHRWDDIAFELTEEKFT